MNISGSDVSKEAADMILLGESITFPRTDDRLTPMSDDNFASTVSEYIDRYPIGQHSDQVSQRVSLKVARSLLT